MMTYNLGETGGFVQSVEAVEVVVTPGTQITSLPCRLVIQWQIFEALLPRQC